MAGRKGEEWRQRGWRQDCAGRKGLPRRRPWHLWLCLASAQMPAIAAMHTSPRPVLPAAHLGRHKAAAEVVVASAKLLGAQLGCSEGDEHVGSEPLPTVIPRLHIPPAAASHNTSSRLPAGACHSCSTAQQAEVRAAGWLEAAAAACGGCLPAGDVNRHHRGRAGSRLHHLRGTHDTRSAQHDIQQSHATTGSRKGGRKRRSAAPGRPTPHTATREHSAACEPPQVASKVHAPL